VKRRKYVTKMLEVEGGGKKYKNKDEGKFFIYMQMKR
jgi:hypothetical protein